MRRNASRHRMIETKDVLEDSCTFRFISNGEFERWGVGVRHGSDHANEHSRQETDEHCVGREDFVSEDPPRRRNQNQSSLLSLPFPSRLCNFEAVGSGSTSMIRFSTTRGMWVSSIATCWGGPIDTKEESGRDRRTDRTSTTSDLDGFGRKHARVGIGIPFPLVDSLTLTPPAHPIDRSGAAICIPDR